MIRRSSFKKVLSSFHRIIASRQLLAIITLAIGLNACYNEPNILGGDLIPSGDKTSVQIDTSFEVSAYTVKTDTIPTGTYNYAAIGCVNSDIFGKTKADFLTQVFVVDEKDTLREISPRPVADSLIIEMTLAKTWGTVNHPINIKVYELSEEITDTLNYSVYYNGMKSIDGKYFSGSQINEITTYSGESSLRIKLKDAFAQKLIGVNDSLMAHNNKFRNFMKGFYITSDDYNGSGGVIYFFTYNFVMHLYYKVQIKGDWVTNDYKYSGIAPRYNHFVHNYETATVGMKINHLNSTALNDTIVQDSIFYLSGLGGTRGIIKLKSLSKWMQRMPIAINRAELRFDIQEHPLVKNDSSSFPLLYYYKRDLDTTSGYTSTSNDVFGIYDYTRTKLNTTKYLKPRKYYSLDVTQHLQNSLTGKVKRDYFFLEPTDFKWNYKEGIFRSGNNSNPIRLIITYSKL